MILELCRNMEELEAVLLRKTNNAPIKKRYEYLSNYMNLLGGNSIGKISLKEKYYVLKKSFLDGDWRCINGYFK